MIFLLAACTTTPESIVMSGKVWDAPYNEGSVVPGAVVTVLDETGAEFATGTAGDDGAFTATVPAGVPFFTTVTAEGHVPTAFSGTAGLSDFTAPEGYPWVAPASYIEDLRAQFASCPTVAEPGGVVAGQIVAEGGGYPAITTASARVFGPDELELTACYLDDEGISSADATETGATGRFAIFGVPAGEIVVEVTYDSGTGQDPVELYRFYASEDGFVPLFPAILSLL